MEETNENVAESTQEETTLKKKETDIVLPET